MNYDDKLVLPGLFALVAIGFLLPFWPLSAFGVLLAGVLGRGIFALALGLLLDIAWGVPPGYMSVVMFPFTLLSLISVVLRFFAHRYLLQKSPQKKLY